MKVLIVASENAPYASVGGLSQAISFLARALAKQGIDARVFSPKYGVIDEKKYPMVMDKEALLVPTGNKETKYTPAHLVCNVKFRDTDQYYVPAYFLENREYFELRANVYGYGDEHIRFALLSIGVLEWLLKQKESGGWLPDLIHANDWHTGYLVEAIKKNPRYKKAFGKIKVLYTIHNFRHQANFNFQYSDIKDSGTGQFFPFFDQKMRMQNALLRGLINADWVNTVSKKHALEVQTKEFGEGLTKYLKKYAYKLSGIANGIDTEEMNPKKDKIISANYSVDNLSARKINKTELQRLFKLPLEADVPVISYIGRLAPQKGIEMIIKALEHIEAFPPSQFIFLGSGTEHYYQEIKTMTERYPKRVAAYLQSDFKIPRKIFSGSDILLVPSLFEPGGIVAMEALRYGCVPLVADTGGLSETVTHFNPTALTGNGFLHERKNFWSFFVELISALQVYKNQPIWEKLVENAMRGDYSWDNTAENYIELYKQISKK